MVSNRRLTSGSLPHGNHLAASMQVATPAERNQLLDIRAKILRLGAGSSRSARARSAKPARSANIDLRRLELRVQPAAGTTMAAWLFSFNLWFREAAASSALIFIAFGEIF